MAGRTLLVIALGFCLVATATTTRPARSAAPQGSQQAARPIRRDGLVKALQLNALTAKELADLIRKRGVDFKLTPEAEAELREAGATPEVIEAVRESYRESASARVDPAQQELAFWNSIQSSSDPEDFKDYLEKYPDGLYAGIARRKVSALTSAAKPASTPTAGEGVAPNTRDAAAVELAFWDSIKGSNDPAEFQAYLDKYPDGAFASLARRRAQPATGKTSSPSPSSPVLPTADQILEANIKAIGGKEVIQKLSSFVATGAYELTQDSKTYRGTVEYYVIRPDKSYTLINVPKALRYESGFDGVVAWNKTSQGITVISGSQLAFKKRATEIGFIGDLNRFKELYPKSVVKGIEKVGGRDAYAVEMTPVEGRPETFYFDILNGMLVRFDATLESSIHKGTITPIQVLIGDYADVGGLKIAMTYRQSTPTATEIQRFVDVKYNVPIDESKFSKPAK